MRRTEQGRTMLETMMVLGVIGILSVTGVYTYKKAMNDVRADGIIKDVLARAGQKKANADLQHSGLGKKRVYTPEYKKTDGSETTKGRYGYVYDVLHHGVTNKGEEYVLVKMLTPVNASVCNSIKSKLQVYKTKNNQGRIDCVSVDDPIRENKIVCTNNIFTSECSDNNDLHFLITYAANVAGFGAVGSGAGSGSGGHGSASGGGDSSGGSGNIAEGGGSGGAGLPQGGSGSGCPAGTSSSGTGECTDIYADGERCCCIDGFAYWDGTNCVVCEASQTWNATLNSCEERDEDNDCDQGVCQLCDSDGKRYVPDTCEIGGLQGKCNGYGTCNPINAIECDDIDACPSGYFCNIRSKVEGYHPEKNGVSENPTSFCMEVKAASFTYENPTTHEKTTYYYNRKSDLKSWCRGPGCIWGYLSLEGAQSWCQSLGKLLLTQEEINTVVEIDENGENVTLWDVLKKHLPKTCSGHNYWLQDLIWYDDDNLDPASGFTVTAYNESGAFERPMSKDKLECAGGVVCR